VTISKIDKPYDDENWLPPVEGDESERPRWHLAELLDEELQDLAARYLLAYAVRSLWDPAAPRHRQRAWDIVVGAVEDHIAPWTTSYATTRLLGGNCRYVLTSSGHIAGIVNPPDSKRKYWTNDELPDDPQEWRAGATRQEGSWWEDWTRWMAQRSGKRVKLPSTGSSNYPPIADAPGEYVHG